MYLYAVALQFFFLKLIGPNPVPAWQRLCAQSTLTEDMVR